MFGWLWQLGGAYAVWLMGNEECVDCTLVIHVTGKTQEQAALFSSMLHPLMDLDGFMACNVTGHVLQPNHTSCCVLFASTKGRGRGGASIPRIRQANRLLELRWQVKRAFD
jgi:hypothetical protein